MFLNQFLAPLISAHLLRGSPQGSTSSVSYNYYLLAMQKWCDTDYQIHGLWPQYNTTSWPEYCAGEAYHDVTDPVLYDSMMENWDNCNSPPSSLWEHEYTRHLTCVEAMYPGKYTEDSLFELAIDLFQSIDVGKYCDGKESDCYACFDLAFEEIPCPQ